MIQDKTNVVIMGGGIIGSLLALILGLNGLEVILIDKESSGQLNSNSYDGRSYALNKGSQRLLVAINIWDEIKNNTQIVSRVILQQGIDIVSLQPFELQFCDYEIDNENIFFMVEDRFLRKVILKHIQKCINIKHLTSKTVKGQKIVNGLIEIILDDSQIIKAELAIGSDGSPSKSASRAKIKNIDNNYIQSSITGVVRHKNNHKNEAVQIFLPSGPLAILPLKGNRSCYVWTMETKQAKIINSLNKDSFLEKLRKVFDNRRGELELDTPKSIFPISLEIAEKLVNEKFALIGDSAHKIHPIAGQGLNLGIRDVASLAEVVILARRGGEDIGDINVLKRYSKWRNLDVITMSIFTDITNNLFSNDNFLLQIGRGLTFNFINNSPRIKNYLMKEASGLMGDIPKLLQGRNI